jgi:hypothetical protein
MQSLKCARNKSGLSELLRGRDHLSSSYNDDLAIENMAQRQARKLAI